MRIGALGRRQPSRRDTPGPGFAERDGLARIVCAWRHARKVIRRTAAPVPAGRSCQDPWIKIGQPGRRARLARHRAAVS